MQKLKGAIEVLRRQLRIIKFNYDVNFQGMILGQPVAFVNFYRYLLCEYNVKLTKRLVERGFELFGTNDYRFMEILYKIFRDILTYRPPLTIAQFFTNGFPERKIEMATLTALRLPTTLGCSTRLKQPNKTKTDSVCSNKPSTKASNAHASNNTTNNTTSVKENSFTHFENPKSLPTVLCPHHHNSHPNPHPNRSQINNYLGSTKSLSSLTNNKIRPRCTECNNTIGNHLNQPSRDRPLTATATPQHYWRRQHSTGNYQRIDTNGVIEPDSFQISFNPNSDLDALHTKCGSVCNQNSVHTPFGAHSFHDHCHHRHHPHEDNHREHHQSQQQQFVVKEFSPPTIISCHNSSSIPCTVSASSSLSLGVAAAASALPTATLFTTMKPPSAATITTANYDTNVSNVLRRPNLSILDKQSLDNINNNQIVSSLTKLNSRLDNILRRMGNLETRLSTFENERSVVESVNNYGTSKVTCRHPLIVKSAALTNQLNNQDSQPHLPLPNSKKSATIDISDHHHHHHHHGLTSSLIGHHNQNGLDLESVLIDEQVTNPKSTKSTIPNVVTRNKSLSPQRTITTCMKHQISDNNLIDHHNNDVIGDDGDGVRKLSRCTNNNKTLPDFIDHSPTDNDDALLLSLRQNQHKNEGDLQLECPKSSYIAQVKRISNMLAETQNLLRDHQKANENVINTYCTSNNNTTFIRT